MRLLDRPTPALALLPALLMALGLSVIGCGGSDSSSSSEGAPHAAASSSGGATSSSDSDSVPEPDDGMMVEGILGHISEASISRGMDRGMDSIFRCFGRRYDAIEFLGGELELYFRVKTDGRVRFVYLRRSTLGDRVTERCIEAAAARFRFTAPDGGEVEFATPLSLEAPEDVRPPVAWPESRVGALVRREGALILADCGVSDASLRVTAYVGRGGDVMAVGAAVDDPEGGAALDCVSERIERWSMPDPGSYPAKITFGLD